MSYDETEREQSAAASLPAAAADVPNLRRQPTSVRKTRNPARRGLNINASFSSALEALWSNRLRSLLTILGVIVGVAAVIVAVTITEGTSATINSRLAGLGTNTLTINSGAATSGGASLGVGTEQTLTVNDATAIAS